MDFFTIIQIVDGELPISSLYDQRDKNGNSILHLSKTPSRITQCCHDKINVNIRNHQGETPLTYKLKNFTNLECMDEIIDILVNHEAIVSPQDIELMRQYPKSYDLYTTPVSNKNIRSIIATNRSVNSIQFKYFMCPWDLYLYSKYCCSFNVARIINKNVVQFNGMDFGIMARLCIENVRNLPFHDIFNKLHPITRSSMLANLLFHDNRLSLLNEDLNGSRDVLVELVNRPNRTHECIITRTSLKLLYEPNVRRVVLMMHVDKKMPNEIIAKILTHCLDLFVTL